MRALTYRRAPAACCPAPWMPEGPLGLEAGMPWGRCACPAAPGQRGRRGRARTDGTTRWGVAALPRGRTRVAPITAEGPRPHPPANRCLPLVPRQAGRATLLGRLLLTPVHADRGGSGGKIPSRQGGPV